MSKGLNIVSAQPEHVPLILSLINELAVYEKLAHQVVATEALLMESLFGPRRSVEAAIARWDGEAAGFALFFHNFSTFLGRPGTYLEDLFVRPSLRGKGIGKALMQYVARLTVDRNCGRMEWAVLEWNSPAIQFYESLGARPMSDWTVFRLDGNSLASLARGPLDAEH